MSKNIKLLIISGPSGVGKGTVINKLLEDLNSIQLAVSATTRKQRINEKDNFDYYFYSKKKFNELIDEGAFLEHCNVHGNKYGTLRSELTKINNNNKICLLEIDTQGAKKIKKNLADTKMIFLKPPSLNSLKERLHKRGTDSSNNIEHRLKNAEDEINEISHYDFVIINDNIGDTVKKIRDFIDKTFMMRC
tara:strand:- start:803 stop:1375 length:573 start_codon:yes stop_codon:yes gene_type:complete